MAGPFLLTKLLLPAILASRETTHDKHPRVIWLSSMAAYFSPLFFDTFKDGPARRQVGTHLTYQQSKIVRCMRVSSLIVVLMTSAANQANVMLARQCAQRFGNQGLVSLSVNPGARIAAVVYRLRDLSFLASRHRPDRHHEVRRAERQDIHSKQEPPFPHRYRSNTD